MLRQNNQTNNSLSGFQVYLYANAALFVGMLYLASPTRMPSSFDYDYTAYRNGSEPYGNSAVIAAGTLTLAVNVLGFIGYALIEACRSADATVAANPAALFNSKPVQSVEPKQVVAPPAKTL